MRSELRAAAALTAVALLALAGAAGGRAAADEGCIDPIEQGFRPCPDLVLVRSPTSPVEEAGELVVVVRVENRGDGPSPATRVAASSPGWEDADAEVPPLAAPEAGENPAEVTIRLAIPDDQRGTTAEFTLFVDPDQTIAEHDSDNNDLSVRAAIPEGERPVPDLAVTEPSHRLVGTESVAITVTVTNVGQAEAPATTLTVSGSGWEEASSAVDALGPGGNVPVQVELPIPASARGTTTTFAVTATPVPDEPDTRNNSLAYEVDVPAAVELAPDLALDVTGDRLVDDGQRLELLTTVTNIGSGDAPATRIVVTAPGWQDANADVRALPAGESEDVGIALVVPESQRGRSVTFALEVEAVPREAGTADNVGSRTVEIPAAEVVTTTPVEDDDGLGWIVPAIVVGALLAGLLGYWWLRRRRRGAEAPPPPPPPAVSLPPRELPPPAPEPEPPTEILPAAAARVVNTGFASAGEPAQPLDPALTLARGASYLFWLDIGPPVARSGERTPADLPWHELPPKPELTVAVYSLTGGYEAFALGQDADVGTLVVATSGRVEVGRQPGPDGDPIARTRLLFPVRAPLVETDAQLRVSIYCRGTLVQSRLVTARVRAEPTREAGPGFESVLDYTLAPTLDPLHLSELPEPTLTVLLNKSAATHDFTFYGAGGFKTQSSFDVLEIQALIDAARGGLRRAAWGDEEDWREGRDYLYLRDDPDRLRRDLVELAKRGFRFYASIADRLAGGEDAFELSDRLAQPGSIQIASVESPRHLLPAALLYDYLGFDSTQPPDAYTLCPRFVRALAAGEALEEVECFSTACESRGKATVVCPSGFWGYRHRLGMPVSVTDAPDSPVSIPYGERGPSVVLAASTDFELLASHTEAVTRLCPGLLTASTRAETLELMRRAGFHLLYFYCHGGVQDRVPFLKVGGPGERGITGDLLFSERIRWSSPRPLVFINGCRTTALEPETAIELVSSLVRRAQASGVIGTEITVFEPLARDFAEAYLQRFLSGATVGEAVRGARLALLARGNPLGLAYIPFALESLRLVAEN
jgi:CARDB